MNESRGGNSKTGIVGRVAALVLAFFAGAVNALFGGGGGLLVVPALELFLGVEERRAHATTVAVMFPLSICSALVLLARGVFDASAALAVTGGATVGGAIGTVLLRKVPTGTLSVIFYGVMIYVGIRYLG